MDEHAKSQATLIDFLYADLDLAFTMLRRAEIESGEPRERQALDNGWDSLFTICQLMRRIDTSSQAWEPLSARVAELEAELETAEAARTAPLTTPPKACTG